MEGLRLGSLGVPSTRAHLPMLLSQPTIQFSTQLWSCLTCSEAPCKIMDSRTLTPAPMVTPVPIDTLGPRSMVAVG
uniref:Uncharacterized protein n=1 Tax=Callorhinchus milii TaxID=7868 RepID=A0A4W3GFP9_CALMI